MANEYPHLDRAPITEAVLDVRVDRGGTSLDALESFAEAIKAAFPLARPMRHLETEITNKLDVTSKETLLGHIHWNQEQTRAVQGRIDGFTVNHVKTYDSWKALRADAQKFWPIYCDAAKPQRVTRCALRFINRIHLRAGTDAREVFRTRVEISDSLTNLLDESLLRIVIPFGTERSAAIVQATEPATGADERVVVLDIDAFSTKTFAPDDQAIWDEFDALRDIKNRCFFESLTPEKVEAYR